MKKCCFIGHRDIDTKIVEERLFEIVRNEVENGYLFFTMGTHGKFDRLALSICKKIREDFSDIKIEVVLTSMAIFNKPKGVNEIYYEPYSDVETTFYDIEEEHFKRRITICNQKMIDKCDLLICYVDERQTKSGAKSAMKYAFKKGLRIINLFRPEDDPTFYMSKEEKDIYYQNLLKSLKNH